MSMLVRMLYTFSGSLPGFRNSNSGTSAVEFAIIAPVLATIFVGVAEWTNYLTVVRRAEMSANSMAQVLANIPEDQHYFMHSVWAIPKQINPSQHMDYPWVNGRQWRVPFAFSQILYENTDPSCSSNCAKKPIRDFLYSYGEGDPIFRSCDVEVVQSASSVINTKQVPEVYSKLGLPVMMVAHVAQYKPFFSGIFGERLNRRLSVPITKISYATRYDGKPWLKPTAGIGNYDECHGEGS